MKGKIIDLWGFKCGGKGRKEKEESMLTNKLLNLDFIELAVFSSSEQHYLKDFKTDQNSFRWNLQNNTLC